MAASSGAGMQTGRAVEHLFHDGHLADHQITPEARVAGDQVVYDRILERELNHPQSG